MPKYNFVGFNNAGRLILPPSKEVAFILTGEADLSLTRWLYRIMGPDNPLPDVKTMEKLETGGTVSESTVKKISLLQQQVDYDRSWTLDITSSNFGCWVNWKDFIGAFGLADQPSFAVTEILRLIKIEEQLFEVLRIEPEERHVDLYFDFYLAEGVLSEQQITGYRVLRDSYEGRDTEWIDLIRKEIEPAVIEFFWLRLLLLFEEDQMALYRKWLSKSEVPQEAVDKVPHNGSYVLIALNYEDRRAKRPLGRCLESILSLYQEETWSGIGKQSELYSDYDNFRRRIKEWKDGDSRPDMGILKLYIRKILESRGDTAESYHDSILLTVLQVSLVIENLVKYLSGTGSISSESPDLYQSALNHMIHLGLDDKGAKFK